MPRTARERKVIELLEKDASQGVAETPRPDIAAQLGELVRHANAGGADALRRLKKFLDDNPQIWERAGDLAAVAERAWVDMIAGPNQLVAESVKRQVARMKADLAGDDPTAIERLLIDHLGACYLAAQHAEVQAASPAGGSLEQAAFKLRKAESAQKRLLNATRTLATLRALVPRGLVPAAPLKVFPQKQTA